MLYVINMAKHNADVAMKYMADPIWLMNEESDVFFNFNHELWAISRSCQNSATAVRNYMCRATWWAIVPIYPLMLQ